MFKNFGNRGSAAALVLIMLSAAGCEEPIELDLSPYEFEAPDGSKVTAELGRFQVPENRSRDDTRQIGLSFVRLKSTAREPGHPIVYLAGGPGGSGIAELTGRRWPLFDALRTVADVIALDQRGTGESNDIPFCPVPEADRPAISEPLTRDGAAAWYAAQAQQCAEDWIEQGFDLDGYNTLESAGDLDALRRAIGAERISLWSISYGSHLAMAAMKTMPDQLDRVVMAGSEGPDETVKFPAHSESFLEQVSEMVRQDPNVGERYPDLLGTMHEVLDRVERDPVVAPFQLPSGETIDVGISAFVLQSMTGFLIKNPEELRYLPAMYYGMAQGDFSFAAQAVYQLNEGFLSGLQAMPLAMDYASGVSDERLEMVREQAKLAALGDALNFPMPHLVGTLEIADLGADFRRTVRTDVPTLFLSGTLDGRTYLPAHEETMQGFKAASHVIIENAGHDMFMSHPDLIPIIRDFFAGEATPNHRLRIDPPAFF